jgi:hypothetical protein
MIPLAGSSISHQPNAAGSHEPGQAKMLLYSRKLTDSSNSKCLAPSLPWYIILCHCVPEALNHTCGVIAHPGASVMGATHQVPSPSGLHFWEGVASAAALLVPPAATT